MIAVTGVLGADRTPDLVDLVSAARDAGHEVPLSSGRCPTRSASRAGARYDMVAAPRARGPRGCGGQGHRLRARRRPAERRARLWRRLRNRWRPPARWAPARSQLVASVPARPRTERSVVWFPVTAAARPALAVTPDARADVRDCGPLGAEALPSTWSRRACEPPPRRRRRHGAEPGGLTAAVETAAMRLRAGEAAKSSSRARSWLEATGSSPPEWSRELSARRTRPVSPIS
jgi:hypothetical protein